MIRSANTTKATLAKIPRISLRPREAAQALGVSEETLRQWTNNGLVPHVRINSVTLYPVVAITKHLSAMAEKQAAERIAHQKPNAGQSCKD